MRRQERLLLPVNGESNFTAQMFVAKLNGSCLPDPMKAIFKDNGNDLQIAATYKKMPKKDSISSWFDTWYQAAFGAWQADEWELTTGTLEVASGGLSFTYPDGISTGTTDKDGRWVQQHVRGDKGKGAVGVTVPSKSIQTFLNGRKDKNVHYDGPIIKPGTSGRTRGAIVIIDQWKTADGKIFPSNDTEVTTTLFHELFHAGQMSRGKANSHDDPHFERQVQRIESWFDSCRAER